MRKMTTKISSWQWTNLFDWLEIFLWVLLDSTNKWRVIEIDFYHWFRHSYWMTSNLSKRYSSKLISKNSSKLDDEGTNEWMSERKKELNFEMKRRFRNAPMIFGIIAFVDQTNTRKRDVIESAEEEDDKENNLWSGRTSGRWELKRWRWGSVRVLQTIVHRFIHSSIFFSSSLPMPCNAIDYSSTTWTITFDGCRIDVFDLLFCCWHHAFFGFFL